METLLVMAVLSLYPNDVTAGMTFVESYFSEDQCMAQLEGATQRSYNNAMKYQNDARIEETLEGTTTVTWTTDAGVVTVMTYSCQGA